MICNKMTSFRPLTSIILSVFFLLILMVVSVSAKSKIGLDLEWRPIKGVKKPPPPAPEPGSSGKTWTDPVTGMQFVWVPGGCYQMGCGSWAGNCKSDEKPVHEVCLDGFWIGKYEVTIGQYRKYLQDGGDSAGVDWKDKDCPLRKGGGYALSGNKFGSSDNQPMVEVSWNGAKAFAAWLSGKTGKRLRLPTEAQWEYACRSGGKSEKYAGGSDVGRVAWYNGNCGDKTHKVGTKDPNGLGLYDMSGNVWEWCGDWYGKYSSSSQKNPTGSAGGPSRVVRSGSWVSDARDVRCGDRDCGHPGYTDSNLGFRLVRTN